MERHESHLEEHSTQWEHQKQNYNQTVWQIYEQKGRTTAWCCKNWCRKKDIPRKTCVKKLVNKRGCLKHRALFNRKPMQFLKHGSYTSVSTGVKRYNSRNTSWFLFCFLSFSRADEVCYEPCGCFADGPPFDFRPLPDSPEEQGLVWELYTQSNPSIPELVYLDTVDMP